MVAHIIWLWSHGWQSKDITGRHTVFPSTGRQNVFPSTGLITIFPSTDRYTVFPTTGLHTAFLDVSLNTVFPSTYHHTIFPRAGFHSVFSSTDLFSNVLPQMKWWYIWFTLAIKRRDGIFNFVPMPDVSHRLCYIRVCLERLWCCLWIFSPSCSSGSGI